MDYKDENGKLYQSFQMGLLSNLCEGCVFEFKEEECNKAPRLVSGDYVFKCGFSIWKEIINED